MTFVQYKPKAYLKYACKFGATAGVAELAIGFAYVMYALRDGTGMSESEAFLLGLLFSIPAVWYARKIFWLERSGNHVREIRIHGVKLACFILAGFTMVVLGTVLSYVAAVSMPGDMFRLLARLTKTEVLL